MAPATALCISHERYDQRDANRDLHLIFPLERLLELEAEGILGRVAGSHYSFGFVHDLRDLNVPAREVGRKLVNEKVDLALLVPA